MWGSKHLLPQALSETRWRASALPHSLLPAAKRAVGYRLISFQYQFGCSLYLAALERGLESLLRL